MAGEYVEFVNNSQPALNEDNLNLMQQRIKQDIQGAVSGDTLPIGCILPFGSDTIPENWLLCNGQAVSRTTYSELYNTIGITFGQGDGFETFNLPDLQGKVVVGKDVNDTNFDLIGETGGEKTHTLTIAELPRHKHMTIGNLGGASGTAHLAQFTVKKPDYADNDVDELAQYTGGSQAHNNLQPYQVQNYIIKAKQTAGIVAQVIDGLTSTSQTDALSANQGKVLNEKSNYLTTEKVIGKWINNKPVYQITLTGTKVGGTDLEIAIPTNIDNIVMIGGSLKSSAGIIYSLDRNEGNNYTRLEFSLSTNTMTYKSSDTGAYFNGTVSVTIQYTKITD